MVADAVLVVAKPFLVDSAVVLSVVAPVTVGLAAFTAAALSRTAEVVVVKAQGGGVGIGLLAQLTQGVVFKFSSALVVVVNAQLVTKAVVAGLRLRAVGAADQARATADVVAVVALVVGFVFTAQQLLRAVELARQTAY